MKKIEMFTSSNCAPCRLAKGYFKSEEIEFEETNIENLPSNIQSIFSVPTIICKESDDEVMKFEGFSQGIGNKIRKWKVEN